LGEAVVRDGTPGIQKAFAGKQHRGRKQPNIIPEFLATVDITSTVAELQAAPLHNGKLTQKWHGVPEMSKFLRSASKMGVLGAETTKFEQSFWGIYRSPIQFLDWAKELEHPKAGSSGLEDALIIALFELLTLGHLEMASRRVRTIKGWLKRAAELSKQEDLFHRRMNPRVQNCSPTRGSFCSGNWHMKPGAGTQN
jgi:hypothetical protein